MKLFDRFYQRLPVRRVAADEHLHLLNDAEIRQVRRGRRALMLAAAGLAVLGFLGYYLPIYWYPQLFPAFKLTLPAVGAEVKLPWASLLWSVLLTTIELILLTMLNIAGAHDIAIATGYLNTETKAAKADDLLRIGLEKKHTEVSRYGIDPFQGLNRWALLLFNLLLRLKGLAASLAIRYLTRLLLGRYAVRAVLDFSGMPLYMAINAYSVHAVTREAAVIIMGRALVGLLRDRLPRRELTAAEREVLYDTLQYIAVSKRDFHENHYLLTRELLEHFGVPGEERHPLPDDYLEKLRRAPDGVAALCHLIILLGFILDGQFSWRERRKLRRLNDAGILRESAADVRRYLKDFLDGAGADAWAEAYLARFAAGGATLAGVTGRGATDGHR